MAHVIQQRVVDGFADVAHGPLHVAGGDDLVGAGGVLVRGQDADLSTRHLLFMDIHRLREDKGVKNLGFSVNYQSSGVGRVEACPSGHRVKAGLGTADSQFLLAVISAPLAYTLGAVDEVPL